MLFAQSYSTILHQFGILPAGALSWKIQEIHSVQKCQQATIRLPVQNQPKNVYSRTKLWTLLAVSSVIFLGKFFSFESTVDIGIWVRATEALVSMYVMVLIWIIFLIWNQKHSGHTRLHMTYQICWNFQKLCCCIWQCWPCASVLWVENIMISTLCWSPVQKFARHSRVAHGEHSETLSSTHVWRV